MIELQRAKLMAASQQHANPQSQPQMNGTAAARGPRSTVSHTREEDRQLGVFLQRLQDERDDSHPGIGTGPTVPTALSRRILHRQGVGFLDSAVAAVASASADRFLVTVLQQSMACRDSRLKGAEIAKNAAKERRRHLKQNQKDADDRKRRRLETEAGREEEQLAAIRAMEAIKVAASPSDTAKRKEAGEPESGPRSKKRKKTEASSSTGGGANGANTKDDDDASYDSLDVEVDKYHGQYDDEDVDSGEDSEVEEDDDCMVLADIARPLEAWDIFFKGKLDDDPLGFRPPDEENEGKSEETSDTNSQDEVIVIDDIDDQAATDTNTGAVEDGKPPATNGPMSASPKSNPSNGAAQSSKPPAAS